MASNHFLRMRMSVKVTPKGALRVTHGPRDEVK